MKNLKTILALIALVAIGFVGGFYTHRTISKKYVNRLVKLREAPGFEAHLYRMLEPTEEQKQQLNPIVERYAEKVTTMHRSFRHERHALLDSMHAEIKPLLDEQQVERLERFGKRFPHGAARHGKKHFKKKRHSREKTEK